MLLLVKMHFLFHIWIFPIIAFQHSLLDLERTGVNFTILTLNQILCEQLVTWVCILSSDFFIFLILTTIPATSWALTSLNFDNTLLESLNFTIPGSVTYFYARSCAITSITSRFALDATNLTNLYISNNPVAR